MIRDEPPYISRDTLFQWINERDETIRRLNIEIDNLWDERAKFGGQMTTIIHGGLFGVRIEPPLEGNTKPHLVLMIEDDTQWHDKVSFEAGWLPDLQSTLREVEAVLASTQSPRESK